MADSITSEVPKSPAGRRAGLLFALILLLALGARIANLPSECLDGDELFTWRVASAAAWGEALQQIREDLVHPPLYYVLTRAFTALAGLGDLTLRLPSLAAGLLAIALLWPIGRAAEGLAGPSLLAAGCLAVHDWHIFYSQQARSYALFCLLTLALLLWALRWRRQPRPSLLAAGFTLAALLAWTHYAGAIFAAALAVSLWFAPVPKPERRRAAAALAAGALTLVPWLAWVAPVYRAKSGLAENLGWIGSPGLADIKMAWAQLLGVPDFPGATTVAILLAAWPAALALKRDPRGLATLAAAGILAPALLIALSLPPFRIPVFGLRHILPAAGPYLLLAAWGLRAWKGRAAAAALLLIFAGWPAWQHRAGGPVRYPLHEAAREISQGEWARLPVYSTYPYGISMALRHYLPHERAVVDLTAPRADLPPEFLLFYRPNAPREQALLKELEARGWQAAARREYRSGARFSNYPALAVLRR